MKFYFEKGDVNMPYIQTKTNIPITEEQEFKLKSEIGKLIELYPGKTESRLMLGFEDNCRLWFGGKNDTPIAFVQVMLFGNEVNREGADKLTPAISKLLKDVLNIESNKIYINYSAFANWGSNGANF